jgi:chemotaxis protein MotB
MKPLFLILYAAIFSMFFASCISQKEYAEMEETLQYYKQEALGADSIRNEYRKLSEASRNTEAQYKTAIRELSQVTATNLNLNNTYQELLQKYTSLLNQSRDVLNTSSYEKGSLQEQLSAYQSELDEKQRTLANMEFELYQKEARLNMMEYDFGAVEGQLSEKNLRIRELESMLNLKEDKMEEMRGRVSDALLGFSSSDLTVSEKNGRLYVSLSQELLFPSGSNTVNVKGRQALEKLAGVLKQNPDIDILVEGHTDTDGTAAQNWDLSVSRATAVVKILTGFGVDPKKVTAAGRSFFFPVASNDTAQGKALNRRTEVILSPNLDELFELINRKQD